MSMGFFIAIPWYEASFGHHEANEMGERLQEAISFARSEALKHHAIVTLCGTKDGNQCSGEWEKGFFIFLDKRGDGKYRDGDLKLKVKLFYLKGKLIWNRSQAIQMDPLGMIRGQNGTFFYYSHTRDKPCVQQMVLSLTGRVRIGAINCQ
jgi:Tfp pilus assembly protein FimT